MKRPVPSIVLVVAAVVAMIAFVALIQAAFFGSGRIEGLASIALLLGGWASLRLFSPPSSRRKQVIRERLQPNATRQQHGPGVRSMLTALGVLTFAFIGFAVDQAGNRLYNLPIELLFCPDGTELRRAENIRNPRPGTTTITQDFTCVNPSGSVVREVAPGAALGVRFVEYVALAYLLMWLNRRYTRLRTRRSGTARSTP